MTPQDAAFWFAAFGLYGVTIFVIGWFVGYFEGRGDRCPVHNKGEDT